MKLTILTSVLGSAAAFSPSSIGASSSALRSSTTDSINGWVADESKPCFGLPGAPYSFMDPLGITANRNVNTVKRLREAEVSMMISLICILTFFLRITSFIHTHNMHQPNLTYNNRSCTVVLQ